MSQLTARQEAIRCNLIGVANWQGKVTYQQVAEWIGRDTARGLGQAFLTPIDEHEHKAGRPLLCALVVRQDTGLPGDGFWHLAKQVGLLTDGEDRRQFWEEHLQWVYECWRPQRLSPGHEGGEGMLHLWIEYGGHVSVIHEAECTRTLTGTGPPRYVMWQGPYRSWDAAVADAKGPIRECPDCTPKQHFNGE